MLCPQGLRGGWGHVPQGSIGYQPSMVPDPEEGAALAAIFQRIGGSLFWELFSRLLQVDLGLDPGGAHRRQEPTPGLAGKLCGKLGLATSQAFGRVGRSMLRAFSRRQHEHGKSYLSTQLMTTLQW